MGERQTPENDAACRIEDGVCSRHTPNNPTCVLHAADSTPTEREAGDVGEVAAAAIQRLTEAVGSSKPDVADAAAVLVNVGDLRRLLRAERAAGAWALREAADLLDSDADRARAEDPNSTPNGRDYFQGQHIALRANAIRLRDRADALAPENAQEGCDHEWVPVSRRLMDAAGHELCVKCDETREVDL